MIQIKKIILIILLGLYSFAQSMDVKVLKCEYETNPVGITLKKPNFCWTFVGDEQSTEQHGFRICMATSIEKLQFPDIWDTGPTSSLQTNGFEYSGEPLKSGQKVYFKVTVYGNNRGVANSDPSWFEMGEIVNPESAFHPMFFQNRIML